ncbi:hypothetical protein [Quadrisphaera granulorum]|nr:hypothetical protein [Quadrisphaera granulorum]
MSAATSGTTATASGKKARKSVSISPRDLRDLALIREAPQAAGLDATDASESAVLALALHEGIRVLREAQEGALYAQEAEEITGSAALSAEHEQLRRRRARNAAASEDSYR